MQIKQDKDAGQTANMEWAFHGLMQYHAASSSNFIHWSSDRQRDEERGISSVSSFLFYIQFAHFFLLMTSANSRCKIISHLPKERCTRSLTPQKIVLNNGNKKNKLQIHPFPYFYTTFEAILRNSNSLYQWKHSYHLASYFGLKTSSWERIGEWVFLPLNRCFHQIAGVCPPMI